MAGPIATAIGGKYSKEAAKDAAKLAERQRKAGAQLLDELDWQPMYASERVPTYQRPPSSARAYLDSFLMGNNPDAISPVSPNAKRNRARAQEAQNAQFGTPQERLAKEQAYFDSTPWKVTPPTRTVNTANPGGADAAKWTASHADLAGAGVNKTLADALAATGTDLDAMAARQEKPRNMGDMLQYQSMQKALGTILEKHYGGNAEKLAADVRAAGGIEKLAAQKGWRF